MNPIDIQLAINEIKNELVAGGNTKERIAEMFENIYNNLLKKLDENEVFAGTFNGQNLYRQVTKTTIDSLYTYVVFDDVDNKNKKIVNFDFFFNDYQNTGMGSRKYLFNDREALNVYYSDDDCSFVIENKGQNGNGGDVFYTEAEVIIIVEYTKLDEQ